MDKEVELILLKLKIVSEEQERGLYLCDKEHSKLLLDYITNLQQENQELNDSITWWNNRFNAVQRDYEDYKSRIKKAVDYIKCGLTGDIENDRAYIDENALLDILNGKE